MTDVKTVHTPPDDVQAAIDRVHDRGGGTVALDPTERYELTDTVHVKPGAVLDCDDAIVVPGDDVDLFHIHPSAYVRRPRVHLPSIEWSSTVFTFDTKYGPYHPYVYQGAMQYTGAGVIGGYTRGIDSHEEPNRSRVCYVHNRGSHDRVDCMTWLQIAQHRTFYVGTVFDIHADDPAHNRWTNGNAFGGLHWGHDVCIRTRGEGKINGNVFRLTQTQPRNYSDCFWDMQQGVGNLVSGMLWDTQRYDQFLRVANDGEHPPEQNLIWSPRLAAVDESIGENYLLTNESFAPLSIAGDDNVS